MGSKSVQYAMTNYAKYTNLEFLPLDERKFTAAARMAARVMVSLREV
jgi:hypothetical protein